MADETTIKLAMQYLLEGQAQGEQVHNGSLNGLDIIVQFAVNQFNVNDTTETITNGVCFLLGAAVTKTEWVGHDGELAYYYNGWYFKTPREGWRVWDMENDIFYIYDGSSWLEFASTSGFGFNYEFDDTTAKADPGSGKFRLNNADLSTATELYIDDEDQNGTDLSNFYDSLSGERILIKNKEETGKFLIFDVSSVTDETGYYTIGLTFVAEVGTPEILTDGDECAFSYNTSSGQSYTQNEDIETLKYEYDSATADADPGAGKVRFNNASLASVTEIYIDTEDDGGVDRSSYIYTTNQAGRVGAGLIVSDPDDDTNGAFFVITDMVIGVGYYKISVAYIGSLGSASFSNTDKMYLTFQPPIYWRGLLSEDSLSLQDYQTILDVSDNSIIKKSFIGDTHRVANDNQVMYEFDDVDTSDSDPGAGKFKINNADFASATEIYIDDTDADSIDRSSFLNMNRSGTGLILREKTDASEWAAYAIQRVEDKSGYIKLYVEYIDGSESFADTNNIVFTFEPAKSFGDLDTSGDPADTDYMVVEDTSADKAQKKIAWPQVMSPFGFTSQYQFDSDTGGLTDG